jgi:signal transduction histidine kinase/ligand-binding sensor domain-containing protein/CheY-like chemotaxis protein/AraC-like DNA-binding protein
MISFYTLLLLVTTSLTWVMAAAQNGRFMSYSVEDGLQNNIVFASTQDAKGMIWFATSTGIDRFDGNHFVHYALPQRNGTYSSFGLVQHIMTDKHQQLWAASQNLVYLYNVKRDRFELPRTLNDWLSKNRSITSMTLAADGKQLLIGTNAAICLYNRERDEVVATAKVAQYVRSVIQDQQGMVWVGTNKGVLRYLVNGDMFNEFKEESAVLRVLAQLAITGISQDGIGRYWFIAVDKGLCIYDAVTRQFNYPALPKGGARSYAVKDVYHQKGTGDTYISLDGAGVVQLNRNLEIVRTYQANEDDPASLSNNAAYDIYCDTFNRIWITTYGGGANLLIPASQPFVNFQHEINNEKSLSNDAAKAVTEDGLGRLWFGTRKGLSCLDRASAKWIHLNEENARSGYAADNVLALANDKEGGVWVATYGGGLMRLDEQNLQIRQYRTDSANLQSIGTDFVYCVLCDSKGRVWAGGIRGPLSYLDRASGTFVRIETPASSVNCLLEDGKGRILVGTEKGIYQVEGKRLAPLYPELASEKIQAILEYSNGTLWIGTLGSGIMLVSAYNKLERRLNASDGLPSDVICALMKDRYGDVWVGTSKGIAHFQQSSKTFTAYSKADGLAGSQVNYGATYYTKNGEIIFGTTDGFSLFNPQLIKAVGYKPRIVLTALTINNRQATTGDKDSPLEEAQIDEIERLVLKSYQNSFSLEFANTSPSVSGKHLYSWKLEGFDKDWSRPSIIPAAVYTNLYSGRYQLLIKAFAKGQAEDAAIRRMTIEVLAPWWRSGWAYLIYMLLLVAGAFTTYEYSRNAMARKKYAERLRLNTSISHEIRTPLTLIKGPVSALADAPDLSEESRANMHLARNNIEKLEAIISQFIDYQKTGFDKMQMQVRVGDLVALLDEVTASFVPLMKEKQIHFTYKKPSEDILLPFDRDKMEKVLNNLISNAVKYTMPNHEINVEAVKDAKFLTIRVTDTGIGIPEDQQQFLFKGYFRADNTTNIKETGSGIGLSVAKELVELHHGKLSFSSAEGNGSVFAIKIPLHNDRLMAYLVRDEKATSGGKLPELGKAATASAMNKKILIAEDNDELREYIMRELCSYGYYVYCAADGQDALQQALKIAPDLVITDVMMPLMNGFQLCTSLRRNISTSHIPVIMLTAIHDEDYLLEGYRSGADDYIKKPFDLAYITTRIENLLENRMRFRNKIMSVFEQEPDLVEEHEDIRWLKEVTDKILDHLSDVDFSVEKLSRLMAMSRPVLFRKFKAIANESPQHFIQQIRLRRAVELLREGKLSITDVAYHCGFSDSRYFSTAFKKHFGKSPSDFLQA